MLWIEPFYLSERSPCASGNWRPKHDKFGRSPSGRTGQRSLSGKRLKIVWIDSVYRLDTRFTYGSKATAHLGRRRLFFARCNFPCGGREWLAFQAARLRGAIRDGRADRIQRYSTYELRRMLS